MSRSTSAPEALRTLRQRGSIAMGIVAMIVGGFMAVLSLFSGDVSLVFVGVMLLLVVPHAATISYALLPFEFAFWIGFALPFGPPLGIARTILVLLA